MYKRYFYCHKKTGESRWEYPDEDDNGEPIANEEEPVIPSSSQTKCVPPPVTVPEPERDDLPESSTEDQKEELHHSNQFNTVEDDASKKAKITSNSLL